METVRTYLVKYVFKPNDRSLEVLRYLKAKGIKEQSLESC
jgi:hypothetical protein